MVIDLEEHKPLSDYSNEFKIGWFDELYRMAEEYAKEDNEHNLKVYEALFINSAKDILKRKKPFRIYEFIGQVIINDYLESER